MPMLSSGTLRNWAALLPGGLRGHDAAAQTVHRALQHDAADGGDAALQAHGDAHVAELEAVAGAQTALFPAPLQLRVVAADVDETADARHRLTEHGGEGRADRPIRKVRMQSRSRPMFSALATSRK